MDKKNESEQKLILHQKNIKNMKSNMGIADRVMRIVVAGILTTLFIFNVITGPIAIGLLIVSGIFVLTGFLSFCPLYLPFGISTKNNDR